MFRDFKVPLSLCFQSNFRQKSTKEVQHGRLRGRINGLMEGFARQLKLPCQYQSDFAFQIFCLRPLSQTVYLFFRCRTQANAVTLHLQLRSWRNFFSCTKYFRPVPFISHFLQSTHPLTEVDKRDDFSTHWQEIIAVVHIKLDQLKPLCKTLRNCVVRSWWFKSLLILSIS